MTLTNLIVDFIVDTEFKDLPKQPPEATKKLLIDTIGVALAGSGAARVKPTIELMREWGGKGESTLWVYGDRLPSPHAAMINGMMAHALDFDDTHANVGIHAGASVIPTALAMAECVQGVNGRNLIASIVLGVDIASRLGLSILEPDKGWHLTMTCGTFASAAVAGKLLRLDREKVWNALGIAYSQTAGTLQSVIDGALTKRIQPGFTARAGILSAFLAAKGITGSRDFFEGKYGLFPLYHSNGYDSRVVTKNLGSTFEISNLAIKPYPCCRCAHAPIDAILDMIEETNVSLEEVDKIDVYGSQAMKDLCGKPFEVGKDGQVDAQFSLQYLMVSAISRKRVGIEDFSREAVQDISLASHTKKVKVIVPPDISTRFAARIEVKKKNGDVLSKRVDFPKGQPENPMNWEECVEKFKRCSTYAAKPQNQDRLDRFIQKVQSLEEMDRPAQLVEFLI